MSSIKLDLVINKKFMISVNKVFFSKLKKDYLRSESERRQIIARSGELLAEAKKCTFALQRGESSTVDKRIKDLSDKFLLMQKTFGPDRVLEEGAYKAALEEFYETCVFVACLRGEKISPFNKIKATQSVYLGGISDATGELLRYATNRASNKDFKAVKGIKKLISDIVFELSEMDLTGYLRNKYDQATGNLKKIEQMDYEIELRK